MKKIKQNLKGTKFYFCVLLVVLVLNLMPKFARAQCDSIGKFSNGATTEFIASRYDFPSKGLQTVFYTNTPEKTGSAISHFSFGFGTCIKAYSDAGTWTDLNTIKTGGKWDFGTDPTTGVYGLKYDNGYTSSINLYITIKDTIKIGPSQVAIKAGTSKLYTSVCGFDAKCAVPVLFSGIYATRGDGIVSIYFKTSTELNSWKFEIERSIGDDKWIKIGEMPSAGNSSQIRYYEWTDTRPLNRTTYYRVKNIDHNGEFNYSPIASTKSIRTTGIEIYPNPAQSEKAIVISTFGFSDDNHIIKIYDNSGKLILEQHMVGIGNIIYPILPAGTYTVVSTGLDSMGRPSIYKKRLIVY